jgi:hypothetical protein
MAKGGKKRNEESIEMDNDHPSLYVFLITGIPFGIRCDL